jgi:hypothetical protein
VRGCRGIVTLCNDVINDSPPSFRPSRHTFVRRRKRKTKKRLLSTSFVVRRLLLTSLMPSITAVSHLCTPWNRLPLHGFFAVSSLRTLFLLRSCSLTLNCSHLSPILLNPSILHLSPSWSPTRPSRCLLLTANCSSPPLLKVRSPIPLSLWMALLTRTDNPDTSPRPTTTPPWTLHSLPSNPLPRSIRLRPLLLAHAPPTICNSPYRFLLALLELPCRSVLVDGGRKLCQGSERRVRELRCVALTFFLSRQRRIVRRLRGER